MRLRIEEGQIHRIELRTRMPFRYGITTVTELPHIFLRLVVRIDGARQIGFSADHLPPKWFTKDPQRDTGEEIAEMLWVVGNALTLARGREGDSVFAVWRELYDAQAAWGDGQTLAPLLSNFGTSLVERALIDAVCRAQGRPFADLLRANDLGIRLDSLHPTLAGRAPADLLPAAPRRRIIARHTVGLSDPLIEGEIAPSERLADGLPQSLTACIAAYGLRHFKLKVSGDIDQDVDRLHRIAAVIEAHAPADYAFSLDGNEQYKSLAKFRVFWDAVRDSPALAGFLTHLLFIEQPLHRDIALSPTVGEMNRVWPDRPPLIIDESDAELSSLPTALSLGYAGTSHKNCKGVFKGIANACLLEHRRRERPDHPALLSGEDLSNIGPVSLLQDLAVMAALGIESVERNGHHYFAGLSMFPPTVQQQVLQAHPDLYHESARGWPTLTIRGGMLDLGSVLAAPFGVGFELDVTPFPPVEPALGLAATKG